VSPFDPAYSDQRARFFARNPDHGSCIYCEEPTEDKRADGEFACEGCSCPDCNERDCLCESKS
jgi:hypothetical protein